MLCIKELCPKGFFITSGDDVLTLPILAIGGIGVISVAANIALSVLLGFFVFRLGVLLGRAI